MTNPINTGYSDQRQVLRPTNPNPFIYTLQTLGLRIGAICLVQITIGLQDPLGISLAAGTCFALGCRQKMLVEGQSFEQALESQMQDVTSAAERAFAALREVRIC